MTSALPKPARRAKPRKPILRSSAPRRSAKRLPRVTQTERGKEEARLNDLFSRVIRLRDPFCRIGQHREPSTDAAHLYPKGAYPRLRWDLRNAIGACRECHARMTREPLMWLGWRRVNLTVHDWEDLMRIHLSGPSPDRAEVRATLTAALRRFSQEL